MALRDDRDDVTRLFEVLVGTLAEASPERLRGPIQVSEVYQTILPYRRFRAELGFDTNQDYETALLRFLSGEGGFVTLHPPEAQDTLAAEAHAVHPDPGLVREFAGATIRLDRTKIERVLNEPSKFAPPTAEKGKEEGETGQEFEQRELPTPGPELDAPDGTEPRPGSVLEAPICRNCGRSLPLRRDVIYCPFCGSLAGTRTCARCGEDLEEGWRFCARCGAPSTAPSAPSAPPPRPQR